LLIYVYTPPGYDPAAGMRYPVLYLLHGFGDDSVSWTAVGRVNVILDRLLGQSRQLHELLKSKGVEHTYVETPGNHTFTVWRRYLAEFLPLLFVPR